MYQWKSCKCQYWGAIQAGHIWTIYANQYYVFDEVEYNDVLEFDGNKRICHPPTRTCLTHHGGTKRLELIGISFNGRRLQRVVWKDELGESFPVK